MYVYIYNYTYQYECVYIYMCNQELISALIWLNATRNKSITKHLQLSAHQNLFYGDAWMHESAGESNKLVYICCLQSLFF